MKRLQQAGMFKAVPISWVVNHAQSGAVAINIEFGILDELEDGEWQSWADYDKHTVYGDWWVVKRDGTVNQGAVDQLVECLGWDGNLNAVIDKPPRVKVQINVKAEEYNGTTRFKAAWMNPEDYQGGGDFGADDATRGQLANRFGSLLRAAAGDAKKRMGGQPASGPRPMSSPDAEPPPTSQGQGPDLTDSGDDTIPF